MVTGDTTIETLSVVLQRGDIIDHIQQEPKDKRTLVDDLECSRSTINRAIRELEALDLVTYAESGYTLTPLGEQVTNCATELLTEIEVAREFQPFLQYLPTDEFDLDLRLLRDAELVVAEPGDPYAMINRHVEQLQAMDEGQFVLPYTGMHATETAHERIVEHGANCELVVKPDVKNTFDAKTNYRTLLQEMIATDRLTISLYDGEIPFAVGVIDDVVQIIVDEAEEPRALVETKSPAVRQWAEHIFHRYKRQATQLDLTSIETPVDESTVG